MDLHGNSLDGKDLIIKKCQLGDINKDKETITLGRLVSKITTGAWLQNAFQHGKDLFTLNEIGDSIAEEYKEKKLEKEAETEASKKAKVPTGEDTGATLQSGEEVTGTESDNKRGKKHVASDFITTTALMHTYHQMQIEKRTCLPPRHQSGFWRMSLTSKLILEDTNKQRLILTIEILSSSELGSVTWSVCLDLT
jgi:hypothetical protein